MEALNSKISLLEKLQSTVALVEERESVPNCEAFPNQIIAKVYPQDLTECISLIQWARDYSCPLYPVSTGKNWGFGASVAPSPHCLLVDFSKMNKILDYDAQHGTVTIEAGVTQEQLYNYLLEQQSDYRMDVTGSGRATSLVGNALERGVGYQSLRHEQLVSLKILLMDGTILETGYGRFENSALAKCLPYGLGPSLNHLFTQSNFGIVLSATFKLIKKSEYTCAFSFSIRESELDRTCQLIRELFDEQIIHSIPKMFDKKRCEVTFCPAYYRKAYALNPEITRTEVLEKFGASWGEKAWTFATSLCGPRNVVEAKLQHIQTKLGTEILLRVVDPETLALTVPDNFGAQLQKEFDELILGYLQGTPSDEALRSMYWDVREQDPTPAEPEDKDYGFLFITPMVANSPTSLENFLQSYRACQEKFGLEAALTLNFFNRDCMEAVISVSFAKDNPFAVQKAHNFKQSLQRDLLAAGCPPYRLDVGAMENTASNELAHQNWQNLCAKLKTALDPENLLAPQRYVHSEPLTKI